MSLTKMEHFLVLTDDIDSTRDFYRDILGMEEGFRPPLGFPGYWLYADGIPCIHIAEWNTYTAHSKTLGLLVSVQAKGTGPLDHIAFNTRDFDAVLVRLRDGGIPFGQNARPDIGLRQVFFTDPNGLKIEINFMQGRNS